MSVYKITFTPSGPYFFGNEKTFSYQKEDGNKSNNQYGSLYYIKGEPLPSQTTILGAVRYILLEDKTYAKAVESAERIGPESFNIDSGKCQNFGAIKKISPVFVCSGDEAFVPTPFDHRPYADDKETKVYTPFGKYCALDAPAKLYTGDYDEKRGLADSFMSVENGYITDDLFSSDVRTGINRSSSRDGFFKKEYRVLKKGFSFAVYAELDESICAIPEKDCVMLGQSKVPFSVTLEKCDCGVNCILLKAENLIKEVRKDVTYPDGCKYDFVYCAGDVLTDLPQDTPTQELYKGAVFSAVKTRDFRSFQTKNTAKGICFEKSTLLHRLIQAGSIFILRQNAAVFALNGSDRLQNAANIGFNQIITIKE